MSEPNNSHVTKKLKFEKFKIADGQHVENRFLSHNHQPIVRFQRNFVPGSRMACRQRPPDRICLFRKSKKADGRYFQIIKAPYINKKLSVLGVICCVDKDDSHFTKIQNYRRRTSTIFTSVLAMTQHRIILFWSDFVQGN